MKRARCWLAAACVVLGGCHRSEGPSSSGAPPAHVATTASAGAEGMCVEHGVLEAVCTKCNPALVPVFQAQGDWCAEHGFPESFCPICHPERGGRPAMDVSAEPAEEGAVPKPGTRVRFKSEKSAEIAGVETASARAALGADGIEVPATIAADPSRMARINASAPGVLRELRAEVGARVARGDVLAVLASGEAAATRSRAAAAEARARAARAEHARETALHEERVASDQDVVAARRELDEAEAELAAARAEIAVVGGVGPGGSYELRAPQAGIVTERDAFVGQAVDSGHVLFTIVDPSVVRVELDVPERHLDAVEVGAVVEIAVGGGRLATRLESISPILDPHARTARGLAMLDNAQGRVRINARTKAWIARSVAASELVSVPPAAIQRFGEQDVVFVRKAADEFWLEPVKVESRGPSGVVVAGDVKPGDAVATTGSFLLKTEVLKASIGSGCCEVD